MTEQLAIPTQKEGWLGPRGKAYFWSVSIIGIAQPLYFKTRYIVTSGASIDNYLVWGLFDVSFGLILAIGIILCHEMVRKFSLYIAPDPHQLNRRYTIQFFGSMLYGALGATFIWWAMVTFLTPYEVDAGSLIDAAVIGLLMPIIVNGMTVAVDYKMRFQAELIKHERSKAEAVSARFEALKNQLGPHFVFNSFNTLAEIIPKNPDVAQEYVHAMARLYRYILGQQDKDWISLEEELVSAEALLFIQEQRVPGSIKCQIQVTPKDKVRKVIPLTLHTLIENVLKHNVLTSDQPIELQIIVTGDFLIVENSTRPKLDVPSTGIGLSNLKKRYQLMMSQTPKVTGLSDVFRVEVPLPVEA